jgi:tRNA(fMet)-specific endonuclease VapC
MKVIDTTFLIDLLKGEERTLKIAKSGEELLTTQINMYELIKGIFLSGNPVKDLLGAKEMLQNLRVMPLDDAGMIKSAGIFAELSKQGKMISDTDCLIAGIALSNGINTIVTNNETHFKRIKGVRVETY